MNRSRIALSIILILLGLSSAGAEADMLRLKALGFRIPAERSSAVPVGVTDKSGVPRSLPAAGEVTLLSFWASWSPPSRTSMPSLNRLHHQLKEQGLQLAAVNMNEEILYVEDYLNETGLDLPIYYFPEKNALDAYKLKGIPAAFLIDKNGRVAAALTGSTQWDHPDILRTIAELLEE